MIKDHHYQSLRTHITNLISGLSTHKDDLPEEIDAKISEEFYCQALEALEKRKRKLDKREQDFKKAAEKFHEDYEVVRKVLKKDVMRLKRTLNRKDYQSKLEDFGIRNHY